MADAGVGVEKYLPVLSSVNFLFVSCYPITVKHSQYQFLPIQGVTGGTDQTSGGRSLC